MFDNEKEVAQAAVDEYEKKQKYFEEQARKYLCLKEQYLKILAR